MATRPTVGRATKQCVLKGDAGNDYLYGLAGNDELHGGAGVDWVTYQFSEAIHGVTVNLETGRARGKDAEGNTLFKIENVVGSDGDDTLAGNSGQNTLKGGGGIDTLEGGGVDTLEGEAGKSGESTGCAEQERSTRRKHAR